MKRKLFIGSLISAFFLFLALRDVQWSVLWDVLRQTRLGYLVPCIFFTMLGHYSRAYRWKFMMLPVKNIHTNRLFSATAIGFMANNLLPARLGEIVRAYVVGREEKISRTASFATIVYERIVDVFTLLALLWITLLRVSGPDWLRTSGLWILFLNVVLFAGVFLMERYQGPCVRVVGRLIRPLPERFRDRIDHAASSFISGLATVRKASTFVPIVLMSAVIWLFAMLSIYYALEALDMETPLIASLTLIVFVSMGSMIPSAPAYLGTMQYACIVGLAIYGVGKSEALAFSFLYHATQFFPITLVGLFYLWKTHIRLGDLSRST